MEILTLFFKIYSILVIPFVAMACYHALKAVKNAGSITFEYNMKTILNYSLIITSVCSWFI